MRRLFVGLWLLGVTLLGYAEEPFLFGDFKDASGDKAYTTWKPNAPWANLYTKSCQARPTGIGLAPNNATGGPTGMVWSQEEGQKVAELHLTCVLVSTTAPKQHTLAVQINGGTSYEVPITFASPKTPTPVYLILEEQEVVTSLVLTNATLTGTTLVDVQRVEALEDYTPITATASVTGSVNCGEKVYCAIESLAGGTYDYIAAKWTFNGQSFFPSDEDFCETAVFEAPAKDGTEIATLYVEDSSNTVKSFEFPVAITPYARAKNLTATNITKSSFDLSWILPGGVSPDHFVIQAKAADFVGTQTHALTFDWTTVDAEETTWETSLPVNALRNGETVKSLYLTTDEAWTGTAFYKRDEDADWRSTTVAGNIIFLSHKGADRNADLKLRLVTEKPPASGTLTLSLSPYTVEMEAATGSGIRTATVNGLTAGKTYEVSVVTSYKKDDGSSQTRRSAALNVTTEAIPTFASYGYNETYQRLYLVWPTEAPELLAQTTFYAELEKTPTLPPGLYLSRILLTGNDDTTQIDRVKAVVLTNTSTSPIALDGTYTLVATRPRTEAEIAAGKTTPVRAQWNFSVKADGKTTFPTTLPAKSELLIFAERYRPDTLPTSPTTITCTSSAIANLTPAYTLTLNADGTPINSLTPTLNSVVRLESDTLDTTRATAITSLAPLPSALLNPWLTPNETRTCASYTLSPYQGKIYVYLSSIKPTEDTLLRFWAEAYLYDDTGTSAPITIPLYTRPLPGYLFRIR